MNDDVIRTGGSYQQTGRVGPYDHLAIDDPVRLAVVRQAIRDAGWALRPDEK